MNEVERVPEPNVLHGTRASQAYKDKILDMLDQAYAENLIDDTERRARAAHVHRVGTSVETLQRLTSDLPDAATHPRPTAKTRGVLYISAAVTSFITALVGPIVIVQIVPSHFNIATALGAVGAAVTGIIGLICAIFLALNDKVLSEEYG